MVAQPLTLTTLNAGFEVASAAALGTGKWEIATAAVHRLQTFSQTARACITSINVFFHQIQLLDAYRSQRA
jgi:hypothetical protein